ncbi:MAG TPA: MG2 domain-containing protein [Syntrophobacter fumaroxidans]|nr:MG2 domain-containing protein [Syntrophobacter fumaroxidans]
MKIERFVFLFAVLGLLLPVVASPPANAGSPFYLTVDRSFSHNEKPQLRIDYTDPSKPMLLRVLRPKDLDRFLDGQFNVSRSYERPVSQLNPGHYFVKGLNQAESPLKTWRGMLSAEFRKNFKDTAFNKALLDTTPGDLAAPPHQVVHGPPQGLGVVREYYVDLEHAGTDAKDIGWWFADSGWQERSYKVRTISLDPLPDGVYLIQAVSGSAEGQCLMQVSSLAAQVKQSTEQLVVRVIDREQQPVRGAAVSYRDGRGKWIDVGRKTDGAGEVFFSNPAGNLDGKLLVRAQTGDGRQALTDTDFLPAVSNDDSVFIVTDRPIFKPGETFFYKGMVRALANGELKAPDFAGKQARITLVRSDGKDTGLQAAVPVTDFASFSGSFGLDEAQAPGLYRLIAELEGKPYGGEFRVRDYVKPVFYMELIERSPTVVPGEPFAVKFRTRRYSGGVPRDVKYEVYLYRKKFEAPQWVAEAGGGLGTGTDYFGQVRSASALTGPRRIYSSVEKRLADAAREYGMNTWDSAPLIDESGETSFSFTVPKTDSAAQGEWIYTVMVRALDRAGSQAILTENIYMTVSEAQPSIRFSKTVAQVGEKGLTVSVRSTYPDGKPAPNAGGVLDIGIERGGEPAAGFVKLPFTTDARGNRDIELPEITGRGRLRAVATMETLDGKPMKHPAASQPVAMVVGGAQGEAVLDNRELELYTAGTILSPGEKAKVFALLPGDWGRNGKGTVWETISGRKIYGVNSRECRGRSWWFEVEARPEYGTGFYHTVTVPVSGGKYREQTLGFRIIPWAKRLTVNIRPEREEWEPLKPFRIDLEVKDAEGRPSPDTELTVTIVDRAVYAVQSELRPGVFDFFYPLPRLNLATFYSDELQGYGYADLLKKPNFSLGALKSRSKLPKKAMRDTAGWFPHVVTDGMGRASITVDLPANVTEWLVTAIAADKTGRVGEATGRFRTVTDILREVIAPQFLRLGEEALVHLKTVNQADRTVSLKTRIELDGGVSLKQGKREEEFTIEKQGERLSPLVLEAAGGQGTATLRVATEAREDIHVGGAEEFDIPLRPASTRLVFPGVADKDRLIARLPKAGKVGEVKVQVVSGLLGAALNASAVLVAYPYGCTEQLVHSTVPNLVLMDLARRAGLSKEDLGPLADVLSRAESNAVFGIRKLIRNQKTDGGFGLWPADPEPSIGVTVTALYALKFAGDLKVEGAQGAYFKALDWLRNARRSPEYRRQGGTVVGYELARLAELRFYDSQFEEQIAYVENLLGDKTVPVPDLVNGLALFAGYRKNSWYRFNERFKDSGAMEELIEKLKKALEAFDPDGYLKAAGEDREAIDSLGFGFGVPSVVSAAMGVLEELDALPQELEARLTRILLARMKNGYWTSTFDTAQVIFNTRKILEKQARAVAEEAKTGRPALVVRKADGQVLGELARIPAGFVGTFADPGTPEQVSELRLEGLGPTDSAYSATAVDVPYEATAPGSTGLSVERTFRRVTPGGSEPLDLSRPLRKGDTVVSEIRVRRNPVEEVTTIPSRFLVIEDSIPSLARPVDDDRAALADAGIRLENETYWGLVMDTQRHPDRTVRIAKVLPRGEITIYQVWQAAFGGTAAVPPAVAFDMYDESVRGNTGAGRIRVE